MANNRLYIVVREKDKEPRQVLLAKGWSHGWDLWDPDTLVERLNILTGKPGKVSWNAAIFLEDENHQTDNPELVRVDEEPCELEISASAFEEIKGELEAASQHVFMEGETVTLRIISASDPRPEDGLDEDRVFWCAGTQLVRTEGGAIWPVSEQMRGESIHKRPCRTGDYLKWSHNHARPKVITVGD